MGTRSTYLRRIEQLETAVIGFGDARLRRIALHVLGIAEAARSRVPSGVSLPAAPVA
jgi:hypothetical protein